MNHFEKLIFHFGSKNKLAKALGLTPQAITKWNAGIPRGRAYEIEVMTNGEFKAQELVRRNSHGR